MRFRIPSGSICGLAWALGTLLALFGPGGQRLQAQAVEPQAKKTVLVLSSVRMDSTGFQEDISSALLEGTQGAVDIFDEYTGLDRFSGPAFEASLLRLYTEKYGSRKLDLIITIGPTALEFIVARQFRPDVPVVTCYIPQRFVEAAQRQRPEITGAIHPQNAPMTLDLMLALYPKTKRIHMVLGASEYERSQAERARTTLQPYAGRLELDFMNDLSLAQMEARLRMLPDEDLVIFGMLGLDAAGQDFQRGSNPPLTRLAKASRRPIFGVNTLDLGHGIVGGVLISQKLSAKASVEVGLKVLGGQKASHIPLVLNSGAVPMFDARELERWGIREHRLPPNAQIEFREVSLWDSHGKEILGGLSLIVLESVLVAGLIIQLRRRKRTELELAGAKVRYRTVADFTYDWEYWQRPDGSFEYLSPACARVSGYTPAEFMEVPDLMGKLVYAADRPAWEAHQQAALTGASLTALEFRIWNKEGAVRWVEQANNPVHLEDGTFGGTRGSLRDITDRKRSELDLKDAYSEIAALKDRLEAENTYYREKIQAQEGSSELLGASDSLKYLLYRIRQVAPSGTTVLIQGETGTGKELVSEAIHKLGNRNDRPLVKINCAALPPGLAESELFGHERGAFTGAQTMRKGRFEVADKATLFLDEVGELSPEVQAKLLRVLQDGEFQRVGGEKTIKVDVRVIAATNRDLQKEVAAGRFREDLWYRLNVFPITVPPLRERKEDIPVLAQSFVARICQNLGRSDLDIPKATLQSLQAYPWPGNVRELQNIMERAVLVSEGSSLRLAEPLTAPKGAAPAPAAGKTLLDIERQHILEALESTHWKVEGAQGAAARLGMKPSTLRNRMAKLEIERPSDAS